MGASNLLFLFIFLSFGVFGFGLEISENDIHNEHHKNPYPEVCVSIGIKHHAHTLPYLMGLIENLRYPKNKIRVLFVAQEESDGDTIDSARMWSDKMSKLFLSTGIKNADEHWMEFSLGWARTQACEYFFLTDGDNFLMENSLKKLISLNQIAVSPLMNGPFGRYSNVYELLDSDFIERKKVGIQQVYYFNLPMLINISDPATAALTFDAGKIPDYKGKLNPIQVFAKSAYLKDIPLFIDNQDFYGYLLSSKHFSLNYHKKLLGYFLANLISDAGPMPLPHSTALEPWYPETATYGFDKVYVINLKRRPERLQKISLILRLLGIKFRIFDAVDGNALTDAEVARLHFLPGYEDPYAKRPMTKGEIGCFLSHYWIWRDIVDNKYQRVIVFEDDVRFAENATVELNRVVEDLMKTQLDWDLIYLGRKKMTPQGDEWYVPGHRYLSTVAYSYWTLGYALSQSGAQKLLNAKPEDKMMALDEFLPIMYDKHPNPKWSKHFSPRNLKAFAVYPVIVTPERYTHDEGYVSDTEASTVVNLART